MTIIKTPNGWLLEPSTKQELDHLAFLLEALKARYGQSSRLIDETLTTHSSEQVLDRHKAVSG